MFKKGVLQFELALYSVFVLWFMSVYLIKLKLDPWNYIFTRINFQFGCGSTNENGCIWSFEFTDAQDVHDVDGNFQGNKDWLNSNPWHLSIDIFIIYI